jgi:phage FluMu protein Com
MQRWYDLKSIAESLHLSAEEDSVIWKFDSKGVYSISSLYAIVNFGGIMPVHIPAVWRVKVQPRVHVFLWLLDNNKLLSKDNLAKRQHVPDIRCIFCNEAESVAYLFFECAVAKEINVLICFLYLAFGSVKRHNKFLTLSMLPLYGLYGSLGMICALMDLAGHVCRFYTRKWLTLWAVGRCYAWKKTEASSKECVQHWRLWCAKLPL